MITTLLGWPAAAVAQRHGRGPGHMTTRALRAHDLNLMIPTSNLRSTIGTRNIYIGPDETGAPTHHHIPPSQPSMAHDLSLWLIIPTWNWDRLPARYETRKP
ncbi:hypothetical protein B0T20DRAFT_474811 [Sordaria brevicollis]|uniref:Uncharacterized protein n=1 Tax=Sordaria brevicollis TaxID=83679 RepID=A0AAE0PN36_SORBR|nr:hypothetical protein B0T20DRAFT_474811 [Sordaria brevicollis]